MFFCSFFKSFFLPVLPFDSLMAWDSLMVSWLSLDSPGSSWLLPALPGSSWLLLALLAPAGSYWLSLAPRLFLAGLPRSTEPEGRAGDQGEVQEDPC